MDLGLRNRVAIVTGSSRGIGRAIASSLAAEGARVMLNARQPEPLSEAVDELQRQDWQVAGCAADVQTEEDCRRLVEEAEKRFGPVDVLVNNVGGGAASTLDAPEDEWRGGFDLTLWPALRLTRLVAPGMRDRQRGVIIMIASLFGREQGGRPGYQVVKSAEISLAKALAPELAKDNVRILSVAPGSILFPGGSWWRRQEADPAAIEELVARDMPLGRFGRPEEVADVVTFLCSSKASLVTGACIPVDGCQGRSLI